MKTQEIRILIHQNTRTVFEYSLEPKNKSLWINGMKEETTDTEQIGLGTIYSNDLGSFEVTDYQRDTYFELTNNDTSYQCSYTYHKIDEETTELVYFEYMQDGSDLAEPMDRKYFEKLKELLEN